MADTPGNQTEAGTATTNAVAARNALLKRNPHLRDHQTSSPFGPLGTRQFLQKQLMTPGSATSASSFEEGASNDGYSDFGTPASEDGLVGAQQVGLNVKPEVVTRAVSKHPTKRLSSPSRESLARRLVGSSTNTHDTLPDEESATKVAMMETELPSELLSNLVVKPVPTRLNVGATTSSTTTKTVALSPQSMKVTRRIVASPRKTMRRVVVRRTGVDGQVHEEVQFMDADGNVVEGDATELSASSSTTFTPSQSTITRRIVTPAKLTRRTLRRTGADGQVDEQVQFLDADGNVVRTEGGATGANTSSSSGTVTTRRTVTPGKTLRRVLVRRTGAQGQVHEEVQFVDADGKVVQSDGSELKTGSLSGSDAPGSSSGRTTHVVSSGQTLKRVLIRRRAADGAVREQVQYVDAHGKVVSTEGGELSKSGGFTTQETITNEGSSAAPGRTTVTRRVTRRLLVRKDGTRVPIEQCVDSEGQVSEGEGGSLVRAGSFSSVDSDTSTGTSSRRTITRRVVSSPGKVVRRTVVHKAGSTSGAESDEHAQDLESEGGEVTESTPGRRVITRVVTPQRVVRRMVVRKGRPGSRAVDDLDIDAKSAQSEDSDGSGRGGYAVSDRIVIPGSRVVSRTVKTWSQPQAEDVRSDERLWTRSTRTPPMQAGVAVGAAPQEGQATVEAAAPDDEEPDQVESGDVSIAAHSVDNAQQQRSDAEDEAMTALPVDGVPAEEAPAVEAQSGEPERPSDGRESPVVTSVTASTDDAELAAVQGLPDADHEPERRHRGVPSTALAGTAPERQQPDEASGVTIVHEDEPAPADLAAPDARTTTSPAVSEPASDEDKAPAPTVDAVSGQPTDGREPRSTQSPRSRDALQSAGVAGVAAAVGKASGEMPSEERELAPVATAASSVASPIVATLPTEESESPSKVPHRKAGRSIWSFWGGDKPRSPVRDDEQAKEEASAAPSDAISYAAEEGATYGPESVSATSQIRSPVARGLGAVESPGEDEAEHQEAAVSAVGVATVEDIAVVSESQHPIERESVERGDSKDVRLGGFSDMKDTRQEAAVGAFESSGVGRVSWEIEGKLPPDTISHEDKAARPSIPSDGTPPSAVAPVVASGKPVRDSERRTTELIDGVEPDVELDELYVEIASPRPGDRTGNDGGAWPVKPCSLAWSNVRLTRHKWQKAVASLPSGGNGVLLDGVSGSVKAGEFLVITGPSRGASLALLSCLAGRQEAMEGNVTVDGREWNDEVNRDVACVMRDELFYETLTVHEHLVFQAQLRMRRTHCLARVERVMEDVGLSSCRDKLIGGGVSLHGISRGERKLLAIATALLTNPSILLVDEPTDGLDAFSAEKLVAKLRWLAVEQGLAVVATLHHPSSHLYGLFDALYLVAGASCVYAGKWSSGVAYFSALGFQCPAYMSPMDYFLLQMGSGDRHADDEGVARVETLKREWSQRSAAVYAENAARAAAAREDAVMADYDHKNRYYPMGCCGQLGLLWARHVRRLSRYGFVFWRHLLAAVLIGVVLGLVYFQLDLNDQQGIQNVAGALFYAVVVQMLFTAYRAFVFMPRETAIALRERQENRGGWSHLLCWYLTKLVAELPALVVLSMALFVPLFLLVGIGHGFQVYVYMQIVLVLAGWAAVGLAFLTLGLFRRVTLALMGYAVLLTLFVACGGLLINVTNIPDWLVWLHYISPVKYAFEALMKVFWNRVDSIDCDWTVEGCVALTGHGVLTYYSMENRSALGDSLILLAICLALFLVAFWFLLALASTRFGGLQWRYEWSFRGRLGNRQQRVGKASATEKHAVTRSSMQRVIERKSQHSSSAVERLNDNFYIQVETPRVGAGGCDALGVTLGWSSLWLKAPTDAKTKREGETEYWLRDASGSATCGEVGLLTGPSAASNVALLESLGGQHRRLKGKVTLNGVVAAASKVAERAAYVARDDLFYETLTVAEHLRFQAQLVGGKSSAGCGFCCGARTGELETELVLDELDLTSKRHVLIRYLSPSDTKLLAIATALLSNPSILLAEEPTAGMDLYSSQGVVLKLRQLARGGRTVVVTMSHPPSHLYALFDSLYVLAGGAAVYHGTVREAVPYFASLGYQCPQYMSPVDYLIRQMSVSGDADETRATLFKEAWSSRYSELCPADNSDETETQGGGAARRRRVGCCGQLALLFRRHVLRLARSRAVFGWHALWSLVLGVGLGLLFRQLDLDQQDIQNWAGAFFFLLVLQMLVLAYRTFVFLPREMAVAEREHRSGRYYMVCWYLTKVVAELPVMLVLSVLLFVPAHLLIGIGHGFKLYIELQMVMWLAGWSAAGLASLLLGLFRRVRVALIVYMLLLALFVLFGGLLLNVDDVPDYLIWLHYISPVKYGYEAMMKLFWGRIGLLACGESDGSGSGSVAFATVGDDSLSMSSSGSFQDDDGCIAHSGEQVLTHYSMDKSRDARSDSIILLELTVLSFFIGYAFLSLRWRRYKSRQQRLSMQNAIDN